VFLALPLLTQSSPIFDHGSKRTTLSSRASLQQTSRMQGNEQVSVVQRKPVMNMQRAKGEPVRRAFARTAHFLGCVVGRRASRFVLFSAGWGPTIGLACDLITPASFLRTGDTRTALLGQQSRTSFVLFVGTGDSATMHCFLGVGSEASRGSTCSDRNFLTTHRQANIGFPFRSRTDLVEWSRIGRM
jgi:hypothetical protein